MTKTWRESRNLFKVKNDGVLKWAREAKDPYVKKDVEWWFGELAQHDPGRRKHAAAYLSLIAAENCNPNVLSRMLSALDDPVYDVRMQIGGAFAACGEASGVSRMLPHLKSNNMEEVQYFIDCISAIGEKAVPELLRFLANNAGRKESGAATAALSRMGSDVVGWILTELRYADSAFWRGIGIPLIVILADFPNEAKGRLITEIQQATSQDRADRFQEVYDMLLYTLKRGLP